VKRIAFAALLSSLALLAVAWAAGATLSQSQPAAAIHGTVVDASGPLSGATVRIQATANATLTGLDGTFTLAGLAPGSPVTVSAWKARYYCAKQEEVVPPAGGITLTLRLYQTGDNPAYEWILPTGDNSCFSCKPAVTQVWLDNDAHAGAAANPRFLTMYNGTDVYGNQSPLTRYTCSRDYGCVPVRPDPGEPYYGPGYKLDFPYTAGNCAACHTPGAAVDAPYGTDPNSVTGADAFGVHCDYCHKVADVTLNPATGRPYPNRPGVLSMDVRRPYPEDPDRYQLFFGTFDDDNVPEEDTYLPLLEESRWCAPCHLATFWDVPIYNSFGEWLDSPYSDPAFEGARTCQQCHMPAPTVVAGQPLTNVAAGMGGVERDPLRIHAHTFPGAGSVELLQNAVTMTATVQPQPGRILVSVRITNDRTGHHVPTDSPLRQLILRVEAVDGLGQPLAQLAGPVVPDWGGLGNPGEGYYAGLPGKGFARVLRELWTEVAPTGAYWNRTTLVSDNRLAAFATDSSSYAFAAPAEGTVTVRATLLFRRAYKRLMDWKGWDVPDVVMEQQELTLLAASWRQYLPLVHRGTDP
jgi:hypothetical protein